MVPVPIAHSIRSVRRRPWATLGAVVAAVVLLPQPSTAEQLPITRFTTTDGLAHNRVSCIVQDSRGFMWFCTPEGLSRFDGHAFTNYGLAEGLPAPHVNDLLEGADEYWIATNGGGAVRFAINDAPDAGESRSLRLKVYRIGNTIHSNRVNVLFRDRDGRIWAGTDGGLFRLENGSDGGAFRPIRLDLPGRPEETVQVWALREDVEGALWVGSKFGLIRRTRDGHLIHHQIDPTGGVDHVWALLLDAQQRIWLGHNSGLVVYQPVPFVRTEHHDQRDPAKDIETVRLHFHHPDRPSTKEKSSDASTNGVELPLRPGDAYRYTAADGLAANRVFCLSRGNSGHMWIGAAGLTEFRDGRFRTYTQNHGLALREITAITEDRGGNLWLGTFDGALRIARDGFLAYGDADGLGHTAGELFEHDGALYVIGDDFRISRFDGSRVVTTRPPVPHDVTPWRARKGGLVDSRGDWWIGTNNGVYRFAPVREFEQLTHARPKAVYTTRDGLADNDVLRLFEDRRGDIWIAHFPPGEYVMTRWDRATNRFQRYSAADGLRPFNPARIFCEDSSGNLWITMGDEVVRYTAGRFTVMLDGIGGAVHSDHAGRLWIASHGGGVMRIDDPGAARPSVRHYTASDGLAANTAMALTDDRRDHIYVAHGIGIDRLDVATGKMKHYRARDGIINTDFTGALSTRNGDLWFGTAKGLLRLRPEAAAERLPPRVWIGGLRSTGGQIPLPPLGASEPAPVSLPPGGNHLQIDYFGVAFDRVGGLRYQYRLDGVDRDWGPVTTQRGVTYANLGPGRYHFRVRAISADGTTSEAPASLPITVIPHVWQRWWFISASALGLMTIGYAMYRHRLKRLIELERVRMRLATDLHDDIGSGLSQVALLSELARQRVSAVPTATEPLSAIGELSRDLVDSMNDIVWAINPRRDHVADLTHRMRRFASDIFNAADIESRFEVETGDQDLGLGPDVRREVWLIFKEAVNNVARHSRARRADIAVVIAQGWLELRVDDNGSGFDPEHADHGNGLASMRQRASRLAGSLQIVSEPGTGSVVTLRVPLKKGGRRRIA